ncbi:hypothetical protein MASR2M36_12470 [Providencia sp.]
MDETYIKVKGPWKYFFHTVGAVGQTTDFILTTKRDTAVALCLFHNVIHHHGEPETVTIDKAAYVILSLWLILYSVVSSYRVVFR